MQPLIDSKPLAQQMAEDDDNFPANMTHQEAGAEGGRGKKNAMADRDGFLTPTPTNKLSSESAERLVRRRKRDRPDIARALANGDSGFPK